MEMVRNVSMSNLKLFIKTYYSVALKCQEQIKPILITFTFIIVENSDVTKYLQQKYIIHINIVMNVTD